MNGARATLARQLIGFICTLALLGGCGPSAGEPASPTPASTSAAPTQASTEPAIDTPLIPIDAYARVIPNDVQVRTKPGDAPDSIVLEPPLQHGVLVVVVDGPVAASGTDWYLVLPTISFEAEDYRHTGWVAAVDARGEPVLQAEPTTCPSPPRSLDELTTIDETDVLYLEVTCFAGQQFQFVARAGSFEEDCLPDGWGVEPAWFDSCNSANMLLYPVNRPDMEVRLFPAVAPEVDLGIVPGPDTPFDLLPIVEVTGQFDHPAARTCRNVLVFEDSPPPEPAITVFHCRRRFVVTSMVPR